MKQITLKVKDSYYATLVQYLQNLAYVEIDAMEESSNNNLKQAKDEIAELYGSWKSPETSDELIDSIYQSRVNQTNTIEL